MANTMTKIERDRITKLLYKIEETAISLTTRCNWITADVAELIAQPSKLTRAEHELENAEAVLNAALTAVRTALTQFINKPIVQEDNHANL